MKKKLVVVLLTAAMSMSLLAGCGGNSGSSDAKSDAKTEAVQALTALGYANSDALRAVRRAEITEDMDTETILKLALKQLAFL